MISKMLQRVYECVARYLLLPIGVEFFNGIRLLIRRSSSSVLIQPGQAFQVINRKTLRVRIRSVISTGPKI